jgi:hypothetical protein
VTRLENFVPGPLPVISAVCEECGLIEMIDDIVELTFETQISSSRFF